MKPKNSNSSWTPRIIFRHTFNFLLYSKAERVCVCVCATAGLLTQRREAERDLRRGRGGTDATGGTCYISSAESSRGVMNLKM